MIIQQEQMNMVNLMTEKCDQSELKEFLTAWIDFQIKNYRQKQWQNWEKDHCCDNSSLDHKINELKARKSSLSEWVEANCGTQQHYQIKILADLEAA